jgi:hypothetical protein
MLNKRTLSMFNYRTGDIYIGGGNETEKRILDSCGFIDMNGKKISVSMLNEPESDIYRDNAIVNSTDIEPGHQKAELEINIDTYLLYIAILLLAFELFYIKRRGDL